MRCPLRFDAEACWQCLDEVDVGPLAKWIASPACQWPPVKGGQPNRVPAPPEGVLIIREVLAWFDRLPDLAPVTFELRSACVSRLIPGRNYHYHQDPQQPHWITRVHVPVVTNPDAWMMFEDADGCKVHFEVGKAYSFNTLKRHAFANDGQTDRVHLLFDILQKK